ncbi:hypothetical protein [Rhizobium sp. M1]|uniref:hypothetical protein n=1 Tax=Rhizobium sp. M1 TaxID=2035453 RepID=UPI001597138B|nr:hypothetical protein [Rhizobium sp. M1]
MELADCKFSFCFQRRKGCLDRSSTRQLLASAAWEMISNSAGVFVQRTALVKLGTRTRLHSLPKVGIPFRKFGTNVEPYERRRRWPPRSIAELALVTARLLAWSNIVAYMFGAELVWGRAGIKPRIFKYLNNVNQMGDSGATRPERDLN